MADPGGGCRGFAPPPPLRDKNIHFFHNLRVFFYRLVGCTPLRVPKNNNFSQLKGFLSGLVGCTDLFFACPIFEWWGASPPPPPSPNPGSAPGRRNVCCYNTITMVQEAYFKVERGRGRSENTKLHCICLHYGCG